MYLPTSNLLAHCVLTNVLSVIFRVIICAITEVANGIVNASTKSVCLVEMYTTLMKQIRFLKSGYPCTVQFLRRLSTIFLMLLIFLIPVYWQFSFRCRSHSVFFAVQIQDQKCYDAHCKIVHWSGHGITDLRLWSSVMM